MKELLEKIEQYSHDPEIRVMTVINGAQIGEKAFVSDQAILWKSEEQGFFAENEREVLSCKKTGQTEIAGVKIFSENIEHQKKMVICGGGHVAISVIKLAVMVGFTVTVLEDRPKFAEEARRAGAHHVICDSFENGLAQIEGDVDTFFVIVTRGHRYDQSCLELALSKEHAYIGMMGSRMRVAKVKEAIAEKGISKELLETVHTPIGLSIGAETPEEIAVSILAEMIQIKSQKKRIGGYSKEIRKEIREAEEKDLKKVLATIVARKGSAPRKEGTKMLIREDGNCVETIGGGCVEARVMEDALLMMRKEETEAKRIHIDMTGREAEDEGMVCGGIVDILLEIV